MNEVYRANIRRLQERGTYTPPSAYFPGSRFLHPIANPADRGYARLREELWAPWGEELRPHLHPAEALPPPPPYPPATAGERDGDAAGAAPPA